LAKGKKSTGHSVLKLIPLGFPRIKEAIPEVRQPLELTVEAIAVEHLKSPARLR
jgi:hypothetical protein